MSDDKLDKTGYKGSSMNDANAGVKPDAPTNTGDRLNGTELKPIADENANLGTALRKVYQQTVDESVPAEMLDLLKRLS